ncbi:MAG: hypothetical protein GY719_09795 [bacterium]|nr:hypothetical protein [bacterium]
MKKRRLLTPFVLALLLCAGPMMAGESFEFETGPDELEDSAGWGIDLDSGKVAVDAGLIYLFDAANSSLVVHPDRADQAAADLEAVIQADGSWQIEGKTYSPVVAELVIESGQEPAELLAEARLPRVSHERVNLVTEIGEGAVKARIFRKCKSCTDLPCPWNGSCFSNVLFSNITNPLRPGSCKFSIFSSCKQRYEPICNLTYFNCNGCTGGVSGTGFYWWWACYDC